MNAATEKQIKFRTDLIEKKLANVADTMTKRNLMELVMIFELPYPETKDEASAQITALKSSLQSYAKAHQSWWELVCKKWTKEALENLYDRMLTRYDQVISAEQFLRDAIENATKEELI